MAVDLGKYTQFDLRDPDDCMDLIQKLAWTNSQIKNELSLGRRYQSIANVLLEKEGK